MDNVNSGEENQVTKIIQYYSNTVYTLALSITKNKSAAEDVYQEVFLRFIKKRPIFNDKNHEKAWILRVTINCCKKYFASAWVRKTVPLNKDIIFNTKEKSDIFYSVLELPKKYRIVIYLFYYKELSISDIAGILGLNESTIKSQLSRARARLKIILRSGNYEF